MNNVNFRRYLLGLVKHIGRSPSGDGLRCPHCRQLQRPVDERSDFEARCFMCAKKFVWYGFWKGKKRVWATFTEEEVERGPR